ncbi:hypothetical protein VTN77DRAFT_2146 [Rasamsonia byssochlamydoides]|uniref:uncharacterized protein n=1 Tax=Rasamsonia byssochlamydoides TaxID=89139 RepID=UPI0037434FBF
MAVIQIQVVSDVVCPWCYIGKRKLEKAISLYQKTYPGGKNDSFAITWSAYYLNPDLLPDKLEFLRNRVGADKAALIVQRLVQTGRAEGIYFKFDAGSGRIGSTRDAHRMIYLSRSTAKSSDVQDRVVKKLFVAYHEQGRDITSHSVLRDVAVEARLDGQEVDRWLSADLGGKEVDEEVRLARESGVSGVPAFVVQGEHRLDGAQVCRSLWRFLRKSRRLLNLDVLDWMCVSRPDTLCWYAVYS